MIEKGLGPITRAGTAGYVFSHLDAVWPADVHLAILAKQERDPSGGRGIWGGSRGGGRGGGGGR